MKQTRQVCIFFICFSIEFLSVLVAHDADLVEPQFNIFLHNPIKPPTLEKQVFSFGIQ